MRPVHFEIVNGYVLAISYDENRDDPRKGWDHLGHMVCWHNRYSLGDENPRCSPETWLFSFLEEYDWAFINAQRNKHADDEVTWEPDMKWLLKRAGKIAVFLPVYAYEHSGITISTSNTGYPFNDVWDAGQVGFIYILNKDILKVFQGARLTAKRRQAAEARLRAEIEEYDQYLTGEVYEYQIYGPIPAGELKDWEVLDEQELSELCEELEFQDACYAPTVAMSTPFPLRGMSRRCYTI